MRNTFVKTLIELAKKDDNIFLLSPDVGFGALDPFVKGFPERFLNTGIAEQNTMGVATGLALSGFKPYVYSMVPFALMRCFEQVRVDVAYMHTNVKIIGVGGGVAYGASGATHHAIEDLALAKALPGMTVCAPADPYEVAEITRQTVENAAPLYMRLNKNNEPLVHKPGDKITIGKVFPLMKGDDIEILTTGSITARVKEWVEEYNKEGISAGLSIFHTIKPLDTQYLDGLINTNKKILIVEEHNIIGGLGESVCAYFGQNNAQNKVRCLGIPDMYSHYIGNQSYILDKMGLWQKPDLEALYSREK